MILATMLTTPKSVNINVTGSMLFPVLSEFPEAECGHNSQPPRLIAERVEAKTLANQHTSCVDETHIGFEPRENIYNLYKF